MTSESSDPIDLQSLEELRAIGGEDTEEMLNELIGLYEEDGSASIATIRQSRTAADAKKLKAAAHALRSPSATLGALNLAEHCRLLELAADSEDPVTLRARIDGLLLEFDHVLSALRSMRTDR